MAEAAPEYDTGFADVEMAPGYAGPAESHESHGSHESPEAAPGDRFPPDAAGPESTAAPLTPSSTAPPSSYGPEGKKGKDKVALVARADAFVSHLHRALRTRGGHDVTLLFIGYTARLTAALLDTLSRSALRHSARKLVALAFQLPPRASVVFAATPSPPLAALALQFSMRLKALVAMLAEWRTMNRMWGLIGMWMAAKELVDKTLVHGDVDDQGHVRPVKKLDTAVAASQILCLTAYHGFEATAWLSRRQVLAWSPRVQERMQYWSARSWAAYIFMELGRLLVDRRRKRRAGEATPAWYDDWKKSFSRTLAWSPLTVHWSLANGFLPEILIPAFAMVPAAGLMKDLWRDTA